MLSTLFIQNYAIIAELEIKFSGNLNIITGETGAGKSILVGALGLVLGDRADSSVLRDVSKKAIVEATFRDQEGTPLISELLLQWDIDAADDLVLRREVNANGKSRAFINDTPVNLSQLQSMAAALVDMHLQFDTHSLGENDFQREVLDVLAGHGALLGSFRASFNSLLSERKRLAELRHSIESGNKELDYNRFLLDELVEADLKDNEIEELEAELKVLSHAEQIKLVLGKLYFQLEESDQPMVQQLKSMLNQLQGLTPFHPEIPVLSERLQSVFIELQDISGELELLNEKIQMDAGRMDQVSQRIALGQKLLKKHGVKNTIELMEIRTGLELKVSLVINAGEELAKLEKTVREMEVVAQKLALTVSNNRKKLVSPLEQKTANLLQRVGMPNAVLKVDIQTVPLYEGGIDRIVFLFDANKSDRFEPLHKVASGGELSRLMLSIKSLVASSVAMPTLIFDEIDSGISGEAARQVGILMKELGEAHQVISITHQPQIAARADTHFYVFKKELNKKIHTQIKKLDPKERIEAIAKMMGGEKPSALVIENAREMVMNN
jgi:DNA repair protein RecN (Recombination protein N)